MLESKNQLTDKTMFLTLTNRDPDFIYYLDAHLVYSWLRKGSHLSINKLRVIQFIYLQGHGWTFVSNWVFILEDYVYDHINYSFQLNLMWKRTGLIFLKFAQSETISDWTTWISTSINNNFRQNRYWTFNIMFDSVRTLIVLFGHWIIP